MESFRAVSILGVLISNLWQKLSALLFCILILGFIPAASANERNSCTQFNPVIFGILPFISAEQLVDRFSPLAQYLSKYLNVSIRIETAPDFKEFARRTHEDKRYDILFTAPHFYPPANSKAGYQLIASVDSPGMWAVIVVPEKSDIFTIDDLKGKRLATVHPMGLSSLLVRRHLSANNINPDKDLTMIATPTHDASLLSSYHGVTDASALMQPPYAAASQQIRDSMRVIANTERTPHIPISVSPRINKKCAAEISALLLKMGNTTEGKDVLKHNRFSGFRQTHADEYEKIRDLLAH